MHRIPDAQVLSAAIEVMARHGYAGATTKQIARAAEINEVTLFRRFGTKANLLRQAMFAEVEQFGGTKGLEYTGDVAADLERVVRSYQELIDRRGRLIPIVLSEASRHPELAEVIEVPQRVFGRISKLIARYQKEGALVAEAPARAVASLLAPLLVPALFGKNVPDAALGNPLDPADHVRTYLGGRRMKEATK